MQGGWSLEAGEGQVQRAWGRSARCICRTKGRLLGKADVRLRSDRQREPVHAGYCGSRHRTSRKLSGEGAHGKGSPPTGNRWKERWGEPSKFPGASELGDKDP